MRMHVKGKPIESFVGPVVVAVAAARHIRELWANPPARTEVPLSPIPLPPPVALPRPERSARPADAAAPGVAARGEARKDYLGLLKQAAAEWQEDEAPRLGAALSYYTIFSLAPILVIAIAIAGLAFGEEAARGQVVTQIQGLVGRDGAEMVQTMLQNANRPGQGILSLIGGSLALLIGATGAFLELQNALDTVWDVKRTKSGGIWQTIKERVHAFGLVLGVGFLLLVSLIVSAALAGFGDLIDRVLGMPAIALQVLNLAISLAVLTLGFALMYRFIPDVKIAWRDVWVGAAVTAVLFTIGKVLIGLYLGQSSTASAYGAAGSFVVLLVWIYYSAQIVLFGAEVTQVYAERYGSRIRPDETAVAAA